MVVDQHVVFALVDVRGDVFVRQEVWEDLVGGRCWEFGGFGECSLDIGVAEHERCFAAGSGVRGRDVKGGLDVWAVVVVGEQELEVGGMAVVFDVVYVEARGTGVQHRARI